MRIKMIKSRKVPKGPGYIHYTHRGIFTVDDALGKDMVEAGEAEELKEEKKEKKEKPAKAVKKVTKKKGSK